MPNDDCPVCQGPVESQSSDYGNRKSLKCRRCGNFRIAGLDLLQMRLEGMEQRDRATLSAWIRGQSTDQVEITRENIDEILANSPSYKVSEKQQLLLMHLANLTNHPGGSIEADPDADYPVIWAHGPDEMVFHLEELARREFIKVHYPARAARPGTVSITTSGWTYLDDHPTLAEVGNQVFVAMSFSEPMKSAFHEGIKPALEKAGYRAYRVDLDQHVERIDAKIEYEIRNSVLVLADVTEQKQGVYYEAGFAMGLGLPVIWSVKKSELEHVHFDTRQYNHIVWTDEAQLGEDLYNRVSALMGTSRHVRKGRPAR